MVIGLRMQGAIAFRVKMCKENGLSQCSSTRWYNVEVTHVILLGKARIHVYIVKGCSYLWQNP